MKTDLVHGPGLDALVAAAAIADPEWRPLLGGRPELATALVAANGSEALARFGRLGWLNLLPLLASSPPYDVAALRRVVSATDPDRLHRILLGGERRHVTAEVGPRLVHDAATGKAAAVEALRAAYAGNDLVVNATEHVLTAASQDLHDELVALLDTWAELPVDPDDPLPGARAELDRLGTRGFLERGVPGMSYALDEEDRVTLVVSRVAERVVVVVDGVDQTLVVLPPPGATPADDERLGELAFALGDAVRRRLLTELASGERTAAELCAALAAPRTTLLHHLAILRAAGLAHVDVAPGTPTRYRLRAEGFTELARLAESFVPTRSRT